MTFRQKVELEVEALSQSGVQHGKHGIGTSQRTNPTISFTRFAISAVGRPPGRAEVWDRDDSLEGGRDEPTDEAIPTVAHRWSTFHPSALSGGDGLHGSGSKDQQRSKTNRPTPEASEWQWPILQDPLLLPFLENTNTNSADSDSGIKASQ